MDPDDITLDKLSKSFEYTKLAREIDSCDDRDTLKDIAKSYVTSSKSYIFSCRCSGSLFGRTQ